MHTFPLRRILTGGAALATTVLLLSRPVMAQVPAEPVQATAGAWVASIRAPVDLNGTLAKVKESGVVAIGYRDSSVPFSYLDAQGRPVGYSIDLCKSLVQAMQAALSKPLQIRWVPVTSASRAEAVISGQADMECGSTTSNLERQKTVAFSPTFFISGTKLLVRQGSGLSDYKQLKGRKVVVTAGTTNEKTMHDLSSRFHLNLQIRSMPDHADSFAQVASGAADAFAMDDALLHGLIARTPGGRSKYAVVGDYLSYDPYGIMFRKDDAQFSRLVTDAMQAMAVDGEIERQYNRWFTRKLPGGENLKLPMSPQLQAVLQSLAASRPTQ